MTKARDLANVISGIGTLAVDAIPALPTSKITSGTFDNARLSASSVTQHVDLSNLNADNLTSGTVPSARVSLSASDIPNLSATKITSDALGVDRIPALDTAKITTGTLGADRIPDLPTSKITSGTFDNARLSSASVTQHVDLTSLSASNLTSGTIPNDRYGTPTFNGSNLTSLPSSAPTTSQVTSAIAGTTASGVGAYGLYKVKDDINPNVSLNIGNTYAGSNLWPAATGGEPQFSNQSGTFRLMGRINGDNSQPTRRTSVWLRIS
jgi:hypothetical protein